MTFVLDYSISQLYSENITCLFILRMKKQPQCSLLTRQLQYHQYTHCLLQLQLPSIVSTGTAKVVWIPYKLALYSYAEKRFF